MPGDSSSSATRRMALGDHRLADRAQIVLVEGNGAVVAHEGLASAALDEHEGARGDLEIAPVGLDEGVAGEVRHELGVELVDVEQLAVEDLGGRREEAGGDLGPWRAGGALALGGAGGRLPYAADVDARAVVPEVRGAVEDQIEQALGGADLGLGQGTSCVGHRVTSSMSRATRTKSRRGGRVAGALHGRSAEPAGGRLFGVGGRVAPPPDSNSAPECRGHELSLSVKSRVPYPVRLLPHRTGEGWNRTNISGCV
jgi:hypothetical protein